MPGPTFSHTLGRLLSALAASWLLALASASCSVLPQQGASQSAPSPTTGSNAPVATSADPRGILGPVLADYDVRNNRAIAAADGLDPSLWATADAEGMLELDLFDTRLDAERRASGVHPTDRRELGMQLAHLPIRQLGAPQQRFPRWAMGLIHRERISPTSTGPGSATTSRSTSPATAADVEYVVLVQATPDAPWLLAQGGATWSADIPVVEMTQLGDEADRRAATGAAMRVRDWLNTGGGEIDFGRLDQLRQSLILPRPGFGIGSLSCLSYRLTPDATGINDTVRAVRAGDRWLVSAAYRCERILRAGDRGTLEWVGGYERIYGGGTHRHLTQPVVVHVLFQTAPGGSGIRLLGGRWDDLLP